MSRQDRLARKAWRAALRRWPDIGTFLILRRHHRHPRTEAPREEAEHRRTAITFVDRDRIELAIAETTEPETSHA